MHFCPFGSMCLNVCVCVMQVKQICSYSYKDSMVESKHGLILRSGFYFFFLKWHSVL